MTGVTLAVSCPISMTSADPLPAAKLLSPKSTRQRVTGNTLHKMGDLVLRVKYTGVGDVECRYLELLEHDFCHTLPVRGCVPCSFGNKDGMFSSATTHDFGQSMVDEWRDGVEVLDYTLGAVHVSAARGGASL